MILVGAALLTVYVVLALIWTTQLSLYILRENVFAHASEMGRQSGVDAIERIANSRLVILAVKVIGVFALFLYAFFTGAYIRELISSRRHSGIRS